jgi:class 3 adenylate cyclase/pimeloyl-ACP methyl ester carboxylesterase
MPGSVAPMPETVTATLLFCDLVGSTARFSRLGDDAADGLRRSIFQALRAAVGAFGGTEVKHLGDGLMVVFTASTADAISSAISMQRAMRGLDPRDGLGPIELRVGISTGEVVSEEGDWFGTPVVEAARLCAAAEPQVILVTDVVRSVAGTRGAYRFASVGSLELKGLTSPVPSSAVEWRPEGEPGPKGPLVAPSVTHRPPTRRRLLAATAVVGGAIAVVAAIALATGSSGTTTHQALVKPSGYTARIVGRSCDPAVAHAEPRTRCGYLVVPEDRSKPGGRQLKLAFSRAPSISTDGSGVPTISLGIVTPVDDLLNSSVRQVGDHLIMAERGATGSEPALECPGLNQESGEDLRWGATDPRRVAEGTALRTCHDELVAQGVDLDAYGSRDVALDVRDLAYALKLPKLNVQAGQDDTQVAREIAVEAPTLVRSFVLEDVWTPGVDSFDGAVDSGRGAYERYLADCHAQPACATAFPDLDAALPRLYAQLSAHPVTVVVPNRAKPGTTLPVLVDGDRAAHTMIDALGDATALPLLAATARAGSPDVIAQYAALHDVPIDDFPAAAWMARFCIDDAPVANHLLRQASVEAAPLFRTLALDPWGEACANWKLDGPPSSASGGAPPTMRAVPTLILAPDLSPISSPQLAADTARSFGGATVVGLPHLTRDALLSGPPCVAQLRLRFLEHPDAAVDASRCIASIPPIQFSGT